MEDKEVKKIFSIGEYFVGKYQKRKPKEVHCFSCNSILKDSNSTCDNSLCPINNGANHTIFIVDDTNPPIKKKRGITNERQAILEEIRTIINQERKDSKEKKKYPPITGRALAIKLSHVTTEDLYATLSMGKDYKKRGKGEFGKFLFGSIKPKK